MGGLLILLLLQSVEIAWMMRNMIEQRKINIQNLVLGENLDVLRLVSSSQDCFFLVLLLLCVVVARGGGQSGG